MTITNWLLAIAGATIWLIAAAHFDAEVAASDAAHRATLDARAEAQRVARQERAAIEVCLRAYGPGAAATWDDAGMLHCKPRRGPKANARGELLIARQEGGAL